MKALCINCHPFYKNKESTSNQLMDFSIELLIEKGIEYELLNIYNEYIPQINEEMYELWDALASKEKLPDRLSKIYDRQKEILNIWKSANYYIISSPLHNFSIPSKLKDFIDNILIADKTFIYTKDGPVGLLDDGRKAIYIQSSGSKYSNELKYMTNDHAPKIIASSLGMMGIDNLQIVRAEGTNLVPDRKNAIIAEAKIALRELI